MSPDDAYTQMKRGIPVLFTGKYYVGSASNGSKVISDTEIIELNKRINSWSAGGGWSQNTW